MKTLFEGWRKFNTTEPLNELALPGSSQAKMDDEIELLGREELAVAIEKAFQGGPGDVRAFMNSPQGKDPKVRKFLGMAHSKYDGSSSDDEVPLDSSAKPQLADMKPTQSFIDLMQSVAFPLGSFDSLKDAIVEGGHGPITVSLPYVIDGHHRWSGAYAINPEGSISANNLGFKGDEGQKLAAAQLAVAAVDPNPSDAFPSKGGEAKTDIIGKKAAEIKQMILANIDERTDDKAPGNLLNPEMIATIGKTKDPVILKWANITPQEAENAEVVIDKIADKVATNLGSLPQPSSTAPDRPDMPQLDHPSIGGDKGLAKIFKAIPNSEFNLEPPFIKKSVKEIKIRVKKELTHQGGTPQ